MTTESRVRAALRAVKRAASPETATVTLNGRPATVEYEFRTLRHDRDHPFLARAAVGKRVVFDVGANVGVAALLMAPGLAPGGRIVCFEPSEDACHILLRHAALNAADGVSIEVVNTLVGARAAEPVPFYWEHHSAGASTIPGHMGNTARGAVPLAKASMSLDAYHAATGVTPDLVKIDVEGAELAVLRGMSRLLTEAKPTIVAEIHSLATTPLAEHMVQIIEFLDTVGYAAIHPATGEPIVDPARLYANRGRVHVLLLPAGTGAPAWLREIETSRL